MITQEQAENMVYQQILEDGYPPDEIKKMPYKVLVSDGKVICRGLDGSWQDVYRIEYMPQLFLI